MQRRGKRSKVPDPEPAAHDLPRSASEFIPSVHLIRIRGEKRRAQAIGVFLRVRETRVGLPGNIMGVTTDHIDALRKAGIPFQYVSKAPNGG